MVSAASASRGLVPLKRLPEGACAVIERIRGGTAFAGRLAAMGLTTGTRIEVLENSARQGPMLVRARSTRIALGRDEALKILAREGTDDDPR